MKRDKHLFEKLISDENILEAIDEVNKTHRTQHGRKNKIVAWVERTKSERVIRLRNMVLDGFYNTPSKKKTIWDKSARKFREICEPPIWPDQYIHHMIIQVLKPVMMRGMDPWCCGSIPGRGQSYGVTGIKKWIKYDRKNTKYCAELDIRHFYDSILPDIVMARMNELIKDKRMIDTIYRIVKDGIQIGSYSSQWFANTILQPLDHYIREVLKIKHYIRYMDNLTLFGCNKRKLATAVRRIKRWLNEHQLELKHTWQIFPVEKRAVNALGFRFFKNGKIILRKHTLLVLKRKLRKIDKRISVNKKISCKDASGMLSRLAMLDNCNSINIRKKYIQKGLRKYLRNTVSFYYKSKKKIKST